MQHRRKGPCLRIWLVCRTGVELPTVTVQYEGLNIGATVHVGGRALPSVLNAYRNAIEVPSANLYMLPLAREWRWF